LDYQCRGSSRRELRYAAHAPLVGEMNAVNIGQSKKAVPGKTRSAGRPQRTQEERRLHTRRSLVIAAIRVVQDMGYANLTISRVASRAGLSNGAIQHHFSSREDLVVAILDALYPVLEISFDDVGSRQAAISKRVSAFIDPLWQIYSRPEYLVIWDIAFGTRGDASLGVKLKAYQRHISASIRKQLTASFADVGLTAKGADQLFSVIISCLRGFALQSLFGVHRRRADLDYVKTIACECIVKSCQRASR
jgi:AcrR family transcriptional regulator